ncbi:hypothetical protein A2572_03690 [Candidatus Collierbacteria bacterium RIFOXYD1_FULL_40_9]|uniref:Uncharacterized protein n=1 Tax=Candidatus Collierbacteria bacterium RIFOXYD1_FULL_40_9 TaxID=1817731 RepID=A0A1F5FTR1_9BACT|nr:MAG: hypothetical protein A2572_03690 [Candidatus Collierbacteria bacterium RIFOXYD1_FULL_40_9]
MSPIVIFLVDHQILNLFNSILFLVFFLGLRHIEQRQGGVAVFVSTATIIIWLISSLTTVIFMGIRSISSDLYIMTCIISILNLLLAASFVNGLGLTPDNRTLKFINSRFPKIKVKVIEATIIVLVSIIIKLYIFVIGLTVLPS